jgi:hypothetical protein
MEESKKRIRNFILNKRLLMDADISFSCQKLGNSDLFLHILNRIAKSMEKEIIEAKKTGKFARNVYVFAPEEIDELIELIFEEVKIEYEHIKNVEKANKFEN